MGNLNPFGSDHTISQSSALIETEGQRAIQEVQAAMVIAKKFPRDQIQAMDRILLSCSRATLAEGALYSYAKGGSDVTGPSIRLAEAIAQQWGNLQFGIRELSQTNGESTVEAFAWDLETNTRQTKVFQVPHVRHTRQGVKALTDPRDIYELVANNGARRLRACILGIIPGDVIESAVKQCETTLTASADISTDSLKKMLIAFNEFGVTQEQIETLIQRRLDTITPALMVRIKKIYMSLRDGMSQPQDWFKPSEGGEIQKTLPPYPDDAFAKELEKWVKAVASGKQKPEAIISMVTSKYTLTDEQKQAINALKESSSDNA